MAVMEGVNSILFLGETGSGKTELAVNAACRLAAETDKKVCFFDMDQTKGLFRSRDLRDILESAGVNFIETMEFQDSPIVPPGITTSLEDPDCLSVFDVGGNAIGARMVGQYYKYLNSALGVYVINPNRPFSSSAEEIGNSMCWILNAARLTMDRVRVVSNPCLGRFTTCESVLTAHDELCRNLKEFDIEPTALTVEEGLEDAVRAKTATPVYPIKIYVKTLYDT